MEYKIVKSKRKSISLIVKKDSTLEVRSPFGISEKTIDNFVLSKKKWVEKCLEKQSRAIFIPDFTPEKIEEIRKVTHMKTDKFLADFPGKKPETLIIRKQKSQWGSCNSKNRISINIYAGLLPDKLFEYILIHELCHLEFLNHSSDFWKLVSYYIPDWKIRRDELKKYIL